MNAADIEEINIGSPTIMSVLSLFLLLLIVLVIVKYCKCQGRKRGRSHTPPPSQGGTGPMFQKECLKCALAGPGSFAHPAIPPPVIMNPYMNPYPTMSVGQFMPPMTSANGFNNSRFEEVLPLPKYELRGIPVV